VEAWPLALDIGNSNFTSSHNLIDIDGAGSFKINSAPGPVLLTVVLPAVSAGIHLGAWNFQFPPGVESLCWRIACIDIALTMPIVLVLLMADRSLEARSFFSAMEDSPSWWSTKRRKMAYNACAYPLLFAYFIARTFIIVESFISLRSVPIGVYLIPSWLQMIPHF